MSQKRSWFNKLAQVIQRKQDGRLVDGSFFMTIRLAEPVTLKIQRGREGDFKTEEVTLVPQTNEKGYSSVILGMQAPRAFKKSDGTVDEPRDNLKYELSYMLPEDSDEEVPF